MHLVSQGIRVAVLAIDPSSAVSGGSILGDKTRMMQLSMSDHAYVRPSPTGGVLGGLAQHTDEVVQLCEAAGYGHVIVETVGVGQSEIDVQQVCDFCLLLLPPAGGDSLQVPAPFIPSQHETQPQTPNPKPQTPNPNPKPQTPNPKPQTPNPKPQTPNPKPPIRASSAASSKPLIS